ncbi:hypothetical protein DL89DRAFT_56028 [Linderina pennispora]|uniref:HAUS augmin-like complex subunit 6 N-terminal domain-containing protein n=1 Tax=Linderina pennispora TaxID=61395 RepID=A0A1Y1W218_9FUNG|nr:uncharacterized protein DL89DRAFT_56028 [Linderina pennispora]ORX67286.1 hypothetical protein DL89DRAFT_56028 [Linderina pennispora]
MESVVGSDHLYPARRAEFWQVLLCMGFDPSAACTGAYSGLALEPTVFENGIYHTKAAEVILHFLFTQLDAGRFRREFFDCWPVCDPRQSRDFRSHSFKWLEEFKKDTANWPADVPVRRSYVDECRGVRFEEMLWTLAKHTALHLLHGPWRPALKHACGRCANRRARQAEPPAARANKQGAGELPGTVCAAGQETECKRRLHGGEPSRICEPK